MGDAMALIYSPPMGYQTGFCFTQQSTLLIFGRIQTSVQLKRCVPGLTRAIRQSFVANDNRLPVLRKQHSGELRISFSVIYRPFSSASQTRKQSPGGMISSLMTHGDAL